MHGSPAASPSLEALEEALEGAVRQGLEQWRSDAGLQTRFDERLARALQPALAAYELDRAVGVSFGNDDFQASVRALVEQGECFRAYPTCFSHANAVAIMAALKRTPAARDIALARFFFF